MVVFEQITSVVGIHAGAELGCLFAVSVAHSDSGVSAKLEHFVCAIRQRVVGCGSLAFSVQRQDIYYSPGGVCGSANVNFLSRLVYDSKTDSLGRSITFEAFFDAGIFLFYRNASTHHFISEVAGIGLVVLVSNNVLLVRVKQVTVGVGVNGIAKFGRRVVKITVRYCRIYAQFIYIIGAVRQFFRFELTIFIRCQNDDYSAGFVGLATVNHSICRPVHYSKLNALHPGISVHRSAHIGVGLGDEDPLVGRGFRDWFVRLVHDLVGYLNGELFLPLAIQQISDGSLGFLGVVLPERQRVNGRG